MDMMELCCLGLVLIVSVAIGTIVLWRRSRG
jgi:hypothetical protein